METQNLRLFVSTSLTSFSMLLYVFIAALILNIGLTFMIGSHFGSQPLIYHYHLDTRPGILLGRVIPNYLDVTSNIVFAIVGLAGIIICFIYLPEKESLPAFEKAGWFVFFWGFASVSAGSAYYHWTPNNWTLVWDRLPMTLAFMSIYYIAQKYHSPHSVDISLIGNLVLGILSMLIWFVSLLMNEKETLNCCCCKRVTDPSTCGLSSPLKVNYMGNQDGSGMDRVAARELVGNSKIKLYDQLIPYTVVQFFPIVVVAYMICTWPASAELSLWYLVPTFFLYLIAKVFESLDMKSDFFFQTMCKGTISGHTLKHFSAGFAAVSLIVFLIKAK